MKTFIPHLLALAVSVSAVHAQDEVRDTGEVEFANSCATCHGMEGTGDGPLAQILTVPVPDLTTLAQANEGEFPMLDVIMFIDGRTGIRGHGYPMPVWGKRYEEEFGDDYGTMARELAVRGRILSLAYYLERIQK
ncbi:c-type cytochrome [Maribius pontilimi]|uniref:C-type cytochrome n=1 Tax=Palleronia pontilimi TaxID=1964209 RepID=A0A934MI23_9RHOB|nr:c-type cytochrome [Palleronia pontilimi]MBJ3763849.1 c-type cytochrome [Palleronia pontilimi]